MLDSLVGARVLVVGVNYAPETTGVAPYTTAVAEHLASLGAEVTVVAGMPHYPQWRGAPGDRRALLRQGGRGGGRGGRGRGYGAPRPGAPPPRGVGGRWLPPPGPPGARGRV